MLSHSQYMYIRKYYKIHLKESELKCCLSRVLVPEEPPQVKSIVLTPKEFLVRA